MTTGISQERMNRRIPIRDWHSYRPLSSLSNAKATRKKHRWFLTSLSSAGMLACLNWFESRKTEQISTTIEKKTKHLSRLQWKYRINREISDDGCPNFRNCGISSKASALALISDLSPTDGESQKRMGYYWRRENVNNCEAHKGSSSCLLIICSVCQQHILTFDWCEKRNDFVSISPLRSKLKNIFKRVAEIGTVWVKSGIRLLLISDREKKSTEWETNVEVECHDYLSQLLRYCSSDLLLIRSFLLSLPRRWRR